jgi:mannose-6-phosphate isomerase-like protein (cupin superfamily)
MSTTFIKTGDLPRVRVAGRGEAAEVLNPALCGARNVLATLRWLKSGDSLDAAPKGNTHELVYLMEGRGVVALNGKSYPVAKGAGVYVGPNEQAAIAPEAGSDLKLFHLVVPEVADQA